MIDALNPAFIVIVGAFFVPLFSGRVRDVYMLLLPVLALLQLINLPFGGLLGGFTTYSAFGLLSWELLREGRVGAFSGQILIHLLGGIACWRE